MLRILVVLFVVFSSIESKKYHRFGEENSDENSLHSSRRLLVDVDVYDRPYTLPYFLGQLEELKCPVAECFLDLHFDGDVKLVQQWIDAMPRTNFVSISIDNRSNRLSKALRRSRDLNVTFLSMFDSMKIFIEPSKLLSTLISKDKPLMTPLLRSTKNVFTSTFFTEDLEFYRKIYEREKLGCFLLDGGIKDFYFFNFENARVRDVFRSKFDFDFDSNFPVESLAKKFDVPMYVCNRENFGYLTAQYDETFGDETITQQLYTHMLIEHQLNGVEQTYLPPIRRSSLIEMKNFDEKKTKFGFDEIFVINLVRRRDRRERLESTFDILKIDAKFFDAIDGKTTVNREFLENLHVRLLPNYEDPYNRRPMNYGELGCFFSHYFIWKEIVERNLTNGVLILEDDVRFDAFFKYKLERVFANRSPSFDWDLIYLGRKLMRPDEENFDEKFETYLVKPSYSHWTVGYALSLRAAKILLEENPVQKILPVDEYLPIMFDRHPNFNWKKFYQNRILKAFAFQPPIVTPTHYFGEPNYISDTENTTILSPTNVDKNFFSVDVTNSFSTKDEL